MLVNNLRGTQFPLRIPTPVLENNNISVNRFYLLSCDNALTPDATQVTPTSAMILSKKGSSLKFKDNFETDKGWDIFEEIVGGSICYGEDAGEVARSTDIVFNGSYSLRVWANKALSTRSNHVIGQKMISNTGKTGKFRYSFYAYIPANDPETGTSGETGPEFSMQNTREITPGVFRTATAGIQYQANPFPPEGNWAIWAEQAPGVAGWQIFTTQKLQTGVWYYMAVEADYVTNKYVRFWLRGGKGKDRIKLSIDLSAIPIALEDKFSEQAFWLTLESENLFNNCGNGAFDYKVYYDHVKLKPRS